MNFQNFTSSHPVLRLGMLAVFLLLAGRAMSQPTFPLPIDVLHGFGNGQVGIVHSPVDIGRIENAFDGIMTPQNVARSAGINPMVVTLLFSYEFNLSTTGVYASNAESGVWSVESAQTLAELDGHSGTYLKLVDQVPYGPHQLAAQPVAATGRVLRLTMHRQTGDNYVHLGEWVVTATANVQPAGLCMRPNEVRLIPNASFQPAWVVTDLAGNEFPLPAASLSFTSSSPAVVSVDPAGVFASGAVTGESAVTAAWNGVELLTDVKVVGDFVSPPAEKRVVKVAMIIIDPHIPAAGGQRFSELFWSFLGGPMALAQQTRDSMFAVSGGTVDYHFAEIHDEPELLTRFGGTLLTVDSMYRLFQEPGWTTLHHVAEALGQSQFLYNELLDKYDLCEKSNAHQIDEVWVWAMPFIGMYESNMTGTNAFWINGAPVTGNACTDLLPIMGFNYERYAGCALHNFTHRIETTMYRVYNTSVRYVPSDPSFPPGQPLDPLQTFMLYDALEPGNAHVGNSHFPPNGVDNYDYDNLNTVPTHAPNWKRYPYLFDQTEPVNCSAWGCEGDCGLNYTSWWMSHIPHFRCKDKAGVLNNWWTYVIDYNEGKALEAATDDCDCQMFDNAVADCDSKGEFPWHDWIARVTLNDLDQPSGKSQYSDFTAHTAHLQAGQT
jgi:hypothetical protein